MSRFKKVILSSRIVQFLFGLLFFLFLSETLLNYTSLNATTAFTELCLNQEQLSEKAQYTVSILLEKAQNTDCEIAARDLAQLKQLDLSASEIEDLTPLSSFQNLNQLYLADNQIVDITPLSSLKRIEKLELSNNNISDINPLANMKKLDTLWMWNNQVSNLKPLGKIDNITNLYLPFNNIVNLSAIASLKKLEVIKNDNF